jgi:putative NADH-flavin reductase
VRIVIVGSTGGTGRELVRQALERGHHVTAFARQPAKLEIRHDRLVIVAGDVLDTASLESAVAGQDAVVCALGHKRWLYPTRILSMGTANLVNAMALRGVRRLVCETSLGVGDSIGRLGLYYTLFVIPFILPFYYCDKGRQEAVIRASALEWTIVRPGSLNNGNQRGVYRCAPNVGSFLWTVRISRADVAAFMLDQLDDDTFLRASPGVAW